MAGAARQLVAAAGAAGLLPRVTSTYRSRAEQTRLYRRSLQGLQPYYVAPPGTSAHEYGWAFDMVVTPFDALADVGYTWQQWGGGWSDTDPVHFELPGASAEARRLGSPTKQSLGASLTEIGTTAFDLWNGSSAASLMLLIPGLSQNQALQALSSPFESFQKWLIGSIKLPTWK